MSGSETNGERPTDYERAICYYALPRVVNPITFGIVIAYAVCVFEASAALIYGLVVRSPEWIAGGAWALAGIMIFGITVFMGRAFLNELRQRRMLAAARGVPNAPCDIPEVPDPFGEHALFRHPDAGRGGFLESLEGDSALRYPLERMTGPEGWRLSSPEGAEICNVVLLSRASSFMLSMGVPSRLLVRQGETPVAHITRRFSFTRIEVEICIDDSTGGVYRVRDQAILLDRKVVGRLYELRRSLYLDIERAHAHPAILGFFATLN